MVAADIDLGPSAGPLHIRFFDPIPATPVAELDKAVGRLHDRATEFARAPVSQKIQWLRELQQGARDVASEWVAAACRAKAIPPDRPVAGEEWIAGPGLTLRNIRLLIRALEDIQGSGVPQLDAKRIQELPHGGLSIGVTPYDKYDGALYGGITAETWLKKGIGTADVAANQASFYKKKDPAGIVALVLGAGNVASIPPMDILQKMFVEGHVCILKMNPVNEYLGPYFERLFKPLIDKGYLAIVYGGAEVGSYLCSHDAVDEIHITGSNKTHDLIVWGPPGPEREERKQRNDPLLKKRITSELGNVSPVMVVPGPYSEEEIGSMAENIAGMITNNASFNCNAAKMLILPKGWSGRDALLKKLGDVLSDVPPRKAYYPGAFDRYRALTEGMSDVRRFGREDDKVLPWTLVLGLDSSRESDRHFYTEPFCALLSQTELGSDDPAEFLREAVPFANDRVWGTLNATLFVHPKTESDASLKPVVEEAVRDLRYGTVAINQWPALAYALCSTPWGGHPSATLADIQSGLGWVHNTVMLENIEKCVVRTPLKPFPKPIYFPTHRTVHELGQKLVDFEASPSWLKVPKIAMVAMKG